MVKRPSIGVASFRRVLLAYDRNNDGCATASRNRSAWMAQFVTSDSRATLKVPKYCWLLSAATERLELGLMLAPVHSSRDFHLTLLTCLAYGHCAWKRTGMHFSPERFCGLCAAAYPRMISVSRRCITHMKQELWRSCTPIKQKPANFIPQHTCRPSVARSRSSHNL